MAAAVPYLLVGSTALSVYGAIKQGQAASDAYRYNADLAKQNAAIAEAQGEAASQAQKVDAQRRMGAMIANYGASGGQLSDGSPADALAESARNATLDNLTLKYNYKLRGLGYTNQANLDSAGADNARTASYFSAASAAAGGAAYAIPKFG